MSGAVYRRLTPAHSSDCLPSTGYTDASGSTSAPSLKEFQKHEQSTPGKSPHLPTPAGLFDDDDNDDDDSNFFVPSSNKPSKTGTTFSLILGT